jgi:hypothetical protein
MSDTASSELTAHKFPLTASCSGSQGAGTVHPTTRSTRTYTVRSDAPSKDAKYMVELDAMEDFRSKYPCVSVP